MANCIKHLPKKYREAASKLNDSELPKFLDDLIVNSKRDLANNARKAKAHQDIENYIKDYMVRWENNYVDNTFAGDITGKLTGAKLKQKARGAALDSLLATDRWELSGGKLSLQDKIAGIRQNYQSRLYQVIEELSPTLLDTKTTARMGLSKSKTKNDDFVRAIIDKDFKNPHYKKLADTWREVSTSIMNRFNDLGGDIKNRKDWDLPPSHDPYLITKAGGENWIDDLVEVMDIQRMGMDEGEFRTMAAEAYKEFDTDGISSFELPGEVFRGKLANDHQKSRFFKFKDADSFIKYHDKYSSSTPIDIVMDYTNSMSSQIGLMERLGPDPDRMIRSASIDSSHAEKIYANIAGHTSAKNIRLADTSDMIRNTTSGLRLPGAMVTAVADVPLGVITERYNGLPAFGIVRNVIGDIFSNSKANRELAADMMAQIDFMIDSTHSAARFADIAGHGKSKWFANSVMKSSLLDAWTYTQKVGTHRSFLNMLAKSDLRDNKNLMAMLDRYGFDDADITAISKAKKMSAKGSDFLDIKSLSEDLSERLAGAIQAETRYSVVEGDNYVRAFMNQGSKKGTVEGEALRFAGQFKTFPASFIANHWMRAARGRAGEGGRLAYSANLAVGALTAGTIVVQLKEIMAGREPIDWDNPELWKKGFVQGGVGSILVDAMASDSRGYGSSVQEFLLGPSAGLVNDVVWKGLLGSFDDMREGEREFQDYLKGTGKELLDYVPYQLWYTKAIMNETFLDELKRMTDDNFDKKERKKERKRYKELGNERWLQ